MNHDNTLVSDLTEASFTEAFIKIMREPFDMGLREMHIADWQLKEYFGWTDDMIDLRHKAGI